MWNVTLLTGCPWPASAKAQVSEPRFNEPFTVIGTEAGFPTLPVIVPERTRPLPHSAEKRPDASVAVCVVTSQVKLRQLEKSGNALTAEGVADEVAGAVTTHVPISDGAEVVPAAAAVVVDGPSTVEVRSTLQADVATNAATSELSRNRDGFIELCPL